MSSGPAPNVSQSATILSHQAYLFTVQFKVEAATAKRSDDSDVCTAFADVPFLTLAFRRVREVVKHKLFLNRYRLRSE